jgi:D-alanyl-D-alanine carboxypeptidase (penicillin-binding protein 5/6)
MWRTVLFVCLCGWASAQAQLQVAPPSIAATSWSLTDLRCEQRLAQRADGERIEPGPLTQLMTAYTVFDAVRQKQITLDQALPVSPAAAKTPGARIYLQADTRVGAEELLRGMIVAQANDAAVALAEGVAGSEPGFAERMNAHARRLGMSTTRFSNATGLPHPQQYATAADLATLTRALLRDFPQYLPLYQLRNFTYRGVSHPNPNWLLGRDPRVDGLITGFVENGGYGIVATAERDGRRLAAVVIGADSEKLRAMEAQKLLNYGFQHTEAVRLAAPGAALAELTVWKGSEKALKAGTAREVCAAVPRGQAGLLKATLTSRQPLVAPVTAQQEVGTLAVSFDGKPLGEYPVVALDNVAVANLFGRMWDGLRLLFE